MFLLHSVYIFYPLTELKTELIPTNTRWCGTQKHLRLRIGTTMTKVQKSWKSIGISCTRRNCLLCHCHGAHPELVLTVAGRSWDATPLIILVERSVMPWKRRSMMCKKPLFYSTTQITFATTVVFCECLYTLQHATHILWALKNAAGEQFMNSSLYLCYDIWMQSFLSYF